MDPNINLQNSEHTSEVENFVAHRDWTNPEQIPNFNDTHYIFKEYVEDEWDTISGDIVLFV